MNNELSQVLHTTFDLIEKGQIDKGADLFDKIFQGVELPDHQVKYFHDLLDIIDKDTDQQILKLKLAVSSDQFIQAYKKVPEKYQHLFLELLIENRLHFRRIEGTNQMDLSKFSKKDHQYLLEASLGDFDLIDSLEILNRFFARIELSFIEKSSSNPTPFFTTSEYVKLALKVIPEVVSKGQTQYPTNQAYKATFTRFLNLPGAFENKADYSNALKMLGNDIENISSIKLPLGFKIGKESFTGSVVSPFVTEDIDELEKNIKFLMSINSELGSKLISEAYSKILKLPNDDQGLKRKKRWVENFSKKFPLLDAMNWILHIRQKSESHYSTSVGRAKGLYGKDTLTKLCAALEKRLEGSYDSFEQSLYENENFLKEHFSNDTLEHKLLRAKFLSLSTRELNKIVKEVSSFKEFKINKELLLASVFSDVRLLKTIDFKSIGVFEETFNVKHFIRYLIKANPRQANQILNVLIENGMVTKNLTCPRTGISFKEALNDVSDFVDLDLENFVQNSLETFKFNDFLSMPEPERDISTTLPPVPKDSDIKMDKLLSLYETACEKYGISKGKYKTGLRYYIYKIRSRSV